MNERELMKMMGLSKEGMRAVRGEMEEGKDWVKVGKEVEWSDVGVRELMLMYGMTLPPPEVKKEEVKVVDLAGDVGELEEVRIVGHTLNWRVKKVEVGGEVGLCRVSAGTRAVSGKYVIGMVVRARRDGEMWVQEGRGPRWKGRW
jgi:hypothetical protein